MSLRPSNRRFCSPDTTSHELAGTAFDYLLRFSAEKLNPNTTTSPWVAEEGLAAVRVYCRRTIATMAERCLDEAKKRYRAFLRSSRTLPASYASSGVVDGMLLCPVNGVDTFRMFNRNDGAFNASQVSLYKDNVQSYSTTEPGADLSATSFLMWSWRSAQHPRF
jgi:hypothetical protein